jgi:hypothetical protein
MPQSRKKPQSNDKILITPISNKSVLKLFLNIFRQQFKSSYPVVWTRNLRTIKLLRNHYTIWELSEFFRFFVKDNTPYLKTHGHKLELLASFIPCYIEKIAHKIPEAQVSKDYNLFQQLLNENSKSQ